MKYFFSLKSIFLLFCVFSSYNLKAQVNILFNEIYYSFEDDTSLNLTIFPYDKYTGDMVISAIVNYKNKQYTVTMIDDIAFYRSSVTSVVIPNSVNRIGNHAFRECNFLNSITIPNSVTSIGAYAFYSCNFLTSLTIPNDITTIENSTFSYCSSLRSLTIPSKVTSIGKYAFCSNNLTSLTSLNPDPPLIDATAFKWMTIRNCTLYVPTGSKLKYANAPVWNQFSNIIELDPVSVKNTAPNAVEVYTQANSVVIKGASIGENIGVYNVSGMQIKSIQAQSNIVKLELPKN